ncbi:MAG: hypothetical protein JWO32_1320 [Bacteroidetes bacterium]|nr:hypothetical protein [Bacteroidota bacterium]
MQKIYLLLGLYLSITGIWPIIHLNSFLFITGPKNDIWLLKTFSLLLIAVGITLILSSKYKNVPAPLIILPLLISSALLFADVYYPLIGKIRPVYLLDGIIQLLFISLILYKKLNNIKSRDAN